jgi:hypothetical protein
MDPLDEICKNWMALDEHEQECRLHAVRCLLSLSVEELTATSSKDELIGGLYILYGELERVLVVFGADND